MNWWWWGIYVRIYPGNIVHGNFVKQPLAQLKSIPSCVSTETKQYLYTHRSEQYEPLFDIKLTMLEHTCFSTSPCGGQKSFNKLKTTCKLKLRASSYFSKWKEEGALICPSNPMNIISQICGISSYYTVMLKEGTSIKLGIRNPSNEERCT